MDLIEQLEQWSREFDRARWSDDGTYDCDMVELSDLLHEAAERLKEREPHH